MIVGGGGAIYDFVPNRSSLIWAAREGELALAMMRAS